MCQDFLPSFRVGEECFRLRLSLHWTFLHLSLFPQFYFENYFFGVVVKLYTFLRVLDAHCGEISKSNLPLTRWRHCQKVRSTQILDSWKYEKSLKGETLSKMKPLLLGSGSKIRERSELPSLMCEKMPHFIVLAQPKTDCHLRRKDIFNFAFVNLYSLPPLKRYVYARLHYPAPFLQVSIKICQ